MTQPAHRSFSQITSWQRCGKAYQLQRVVRVPEVPAVYLAAGNAVHEAFELVEKNPTVEPAWLGAAWSTIFEDKVRDLEETSGVSRAEWRIGGRKSKDKPDGETVDWWRAEGWRQITVFQSWLNDRLAEGWSIPEFAGNLAVELEMMASFGDVPVKMFADLVMTTPTGELIVIDHKTGSRQPDTFQQLALYAFGMQKIGLPMPTLGAYFMTRKGELTEPTGFVDADLRSLTDTFVTVDKAIRAGLFPAHVSSMCRSCGVAQYCAAVNGSKATENDPIYTESKV